MVFSGYHLSQAFDRQRSGRVDVSKSGLWQIGEGNRYLVRKMFRYFMIM